MPKPRSKGSRSKSAKPKQTPDWIEARRLYEVEGVSCRQIALRIGVKPHTVGAHRDAERWTERHTIGTSAARAAAEQIAAEIVAETAPAIVQLEIDRARQRRRALALNERMLDRIAFRIAPDLVEGPVPPAFAPGDEEPPSLVLRRCILNLGRSDGDDATDDRGADAAAADASAVQAALAGLDRE